MDDFLCYDPNYSSSLKSLIQWKVPGSNSISGNNPLLISTVNNKISNATANLSPTCNVTQSCPNAPPMSPVPKLSYPNSKTCNFTSLKVTKEGRKYDLLVSTPIAPTARILQVTGGYINKPAKLTFELIGPVGPCSQVHANKKSFDVNFDKGNIITGDSTENKLVAKFKSSNILKTWPWNTEPAKYSLKANRCGNGGIDAQVEVYPDLEIELKFAYNFGSTVTSTDSHTTVSRNKVPGSSGSGLLNETTKQTDYKTTEKTKGFTITGFIKYDDVQQSVEATFPRVIKIIEAVSKVPETVMKTMEEIRGDKKDADYQNSLESSSNREFKWPNIEIGINASWVEDEGKPTCSYTGKVFVRGTPFIGITLTWDISKTILTYLSGGTVLAVQEFFEQLNLELFKVLLKIGGVAEGEVAANITKKDITVDGNVKVTIPFSIEATAFKFEKNIWKFRISIEASIILETGVEFVVTYIKEVRTFTLKGTFKDLVISVIGKTEIGGAKQNSRENKNKPPTPGTTNENDNSVKPNTEGKHVIYENKVENPFLDKQFPLNNSKD